MKRYLLAAALTLAASPAIPAGRQPTMQEAVARAASDIDDLESKVSALEYKISVLEREVKQLRDAQP